MDLCVHTSMYTEQSRLLRSGLSEIHFTFSGHYVFSQMFLNFRIPPPLAGATAITWKISKDLDAFNFIYFSQRLAWAVTKVEYLILIIFSNDEMYSTASLFPEKWRGLDFLARVVLKRRLLSSLSSDTLSLRWFVFPSAAEQPVRTSEEDCRCGLGTSFCLPVILNIFSQPTPYPLPPELFLPPHSRP